ncbi:MAG: SDR family oxidoreductase [Candidatus Tectomicrobia bacterium]|uniref:SDR family oxidoreductase n=1 Tax=Tectimicrobiota bacterium TaxID=2528274 RepID=A0A933LPN5_UNCTE|nr:SDR family oxidoreductase [Candidatus Tectomicrobia bacterium]
MTKLLIGKVALVTGGGSGIGRASAWLFAREGAKVLVTDIDMESGQETVKQIKDGGSEALFIKADVSKAPEVEGLIRQTVAAYGRLDCAHNNAGIEGIGGRIPEISEESWDSIIAINLRGVWLCMKYEIPQMLKQGSGAIVNTASVAGLVGMPGSGAYVASKHGVIGLTKTAALEYAKAGVRINAVCPGVIHTPMAERIAGRHPGAMKAMSAAQPVGRTGKPEEIAEAVVWLCSEAASLVTGQALAVDGGYVAR